MKHISFLYLAATLLTAAVCSCNDNTPEGRIKKALNESEWETTKPFEVTEVTVHGDSVSLSVKVDSRYQPMMKVIDDMNENLEKAYNRVNYLMSGVDTSSLEAMIKDLDFSLKGQACPATNCFNNTAAAEIADFYRAQGDEGVKVVTSNFYDQYSGEFLSAITVSDTNYSDILRLLNSGEDKKTVVDLFNTIVSMENGMKITKVSLPTQYDSVTFFNDIVINPNTYDYYYSMGEWAFIVLDDDTIREFAEDTGRSLAQMVRSLDMDPAKFGLLDKKLVYHYVNHTIDKEMFRIEFKLTDFNDFEIIHTSEQ